MNKNGPSLPYLTIGPRVRKSPYYDATVRAGAKAFTVYNHMYLPTTYGDPIDEYWNIVQGVTLWDVASERQIEVSGPDAEQLVQILTPRDISQCPVGRCRYVVFTDNDGGIVNDAVMLRLAQGKFWLSPGDGDVLLWAKGVAARSGLDVKVHEPDVSPLQLQGPLAPKVARKLFGPVAIEMGYFHLVELELQGIPVVLSRTGWSGELGYEIYLRDGSRGTELWDLCMAAGEEFGIKPATPSTIRSIEGGILSYCSDITHHDTPFTIGMERLLNLDKTIDYIGREALQSVAREGTPRRLVGVNIEGAAIAGNDQFWDVLHDDQAIGHLTRCCFSPRLEHNIGLVNIPTALTTPGTIVGVKVTDDDVRQATVVELPWFKSITKMPADI
ncbi:MAG: glycine cleavage T C-terminal barrel domain-containing protein [Halioglobus sp.]